MRLAVWGDAGHLPRSRGDVRRDRGRLGAVRPVVQPCVLRVVVPVPEERHPRRRRRSAARLPLHLAPPPRPLRPGLAGGTRRQADEGPAARVPADPPRGRAARTGVHRIRADRPRRTGVAARRAAGGDPRLHRARRRPGRGLRAGPARRDRDAPQPERRPAARPRRARVLRPLRRALHPVLGRHLVPDGLRLPTGRAAPPGHPQTRRPDGAGDPLPRGCRRAGAVPRRRSAVLPRRRRCSASTISTTIPPTSSRTS